jgi:hypothetical protein
LQDYYPDIEIDLEDFFVTGFLDCDIFDTYIPGGGPMEDESDAPRFLYREPSTTIGQRSLV